MPNIALGVGDIDMDRKKNLCLSGPYVLLGKERHKLQNIHHVRRGEGLWQNKQGMGKGRVLDVPSFSIKHEDAHSCRVRRGSWHLPS